MEGVCAVDILVLHTTAEQNASLSLCIYIYVDGQQTASQCYPPPIPVHHHFIEYVYRNRYYGHVLMGDREWFDVKLGVDQHPPLSCHYQLGNEDSDVTRGRAGNFFFWGDTTHQ